MASSYYEDGEQTMEQLLQAQAHIWKHSYAFISSMCLKCSVELSIPTVIHGHGGAMTLKQLVEAIPVQPTKSRGLYRVMRVLVHSGFFELLNGENERAVGKEEEAYALNNVSNLLVRDNSLNIESYVQLMGNTQPMDILGCLSAWFQSDHLFLTEMVLGKKPWDFMTTEPELRRLFNNGMASDARFVARVLVNCCKSVFEGLKSLVDLGGGTGEMGKAITYAFPSIDYIVFDLLPVVSSLQGTRKLKFVGGDMFNDKIPPADAILLKNILHDWNDEESLKILKICREVLPSKEDGGKLIIIDMVIDSSPGPEGNHKLKETQLLHDVFIMCLMGKERSREEWAKLFSDAGFSSYKISHAFGLQSLIEVFP